MSSMTTRSPEKRDYSAFDADLTHAALNYTMFVRLLGWIRPYWSSLAWSVGFIVISAVISVLIPIVTGRVVIDSIMLPSEQAETLPD